MQLRSFAVAFTMAAGIAFGAEGCPVTKADAAFVPPSPYPKAQGNSYYVGTAKLWVLVFGGPWRGLPVWPEGYRQKVTWFSEGYNAKADPHPAITISGRRLDGAAPPMVVTGANGSWTSVDFIMSGVNFPTAGCWEVSGKFHGADVKFVVAIE